MSRETNLKIAKHFFSEINQDGFKFFKLPINMSRELGFTLTSLDGKSLQFDKSWDWVMPIIDLIECDGYFFTISFYEIVIRKHSEIVMTQSVTTTKLKAVNKILTRFITYVNNNSY
jgi:hypothetical protein